MTATTRTSRSLWLILRWPLLLALVTAIGLGAALVGDGWMDALSWAALGAVVAVMVLAWYEVGRLFSQG